MEILSNNDIHLHFLVGLPINIEGIGNFHAPLIPEVITMTENEYMKSLGFILINKDDINSEDLREFTNFQVVISLINNDDEYKNSLLKGLSLLINEDVFLHENGLIYFKEVSDESLLTEEKFNYIVTLVSIANHINKKEDDDERPANEAARQMYIKKKQKEARLASFKKSKITLHSIISAVSLKSSNFNIKDLNIYQLYDAHSRLRILDNYHYTMQGIYAGTIEGKDLKMDEFDWANVNDTKKK